MLNPNNKEATQNEPYIFSDVERKRLKFIEYLYQKGSINEGLPTESFLPVNPRLSLTEKLRQLRPFLVKDILSEAMPKLSFLDLANLTVVVSLSQFSRAEINLQKVLEQEGGILRIQY